MRPTGWPTGWATDWPTGCARMRRATADVGPLVAFRLAGLRGHARRKATAAGVALVAVTLLVAVVPAYVPGAATSDRARDLMVLLPTALLAFLLTTTLATAVTGGGRELLPRGEGVAFPVSPTTDHLGALLLAPLNLAWMLQAWSLLGATAYGVGPGGLVAAQVIVLTWLAAATAAAQLLAWCIEWVRRGPHGLLVVRTAGAALVVAGGGLVATERVAAVFDRSPTVAVVVVALRGAAGDWTSWLLGTVSVAAAGAVVALLGAGAAHAVARRPPREQQRAEARTFSSRPTPRSEHQALVRTDRASIWRSVPLRRGLVTLALLPVAVTATGQLSWSLLPILPGVVVAGGALLFGVNAWCLDGVGSLWRESLPTSPGAAFVARARVLVEVLLATAVLPLLVAGVRIGEAPTSAQLASVSATLLVVSLQVVARSMHWSVRHPYGADVRTARGAPAPPSAMVAYSARLSLTSTLTGLLFTLTAKADGPMPAVVLALPLLLFALRRLVATAREWADPRVRARVVATVAAQ